MAEENERKVRTKKKIAKGMKKYLENMSNEALKAAIIKRKECMKKAQDISTQLIEPEVNETWMLHNLIHLNQSHFEDVIEERFLQSLCSYPLCSNNLRDIPQQQFKISTKTNRVYNISDRKKFCSNTCFKASNFIKDQLCTSPLWLREFEEKAQYELYKPENSSEAGEEVDIRLTEDVKTDDSTKDDQMERLGDVLEAVEKICKSRTVTTEGVQKKSVTFDVPAEFDMKEEESDEFEDATDSPLDVRIDEDLSKDSVQSFDVEEEILEKLMERKREELGRRRKVQRQQVPIREIVIGIERKVRSWITVTTLRYLLGEGAVQDLFGEAGAAVPKSEEQSENWGKADRLGEVLGGTLEGAGSSRAGKPAPDYEQLKREAKDLEIKVRQFYRGDRVVTFNEVPDVASTDDRPVLPMVDLASAKTTRRKILLDKLIVSFEEMKEILGVQGVDFNPQLKPLVSTFELGPNNILFKPSEYSILTLMMMKLLSLKDRSWDDVFRSDSVQSSLATLLTAFELDLGYLDRLVSYLTDIGPFLHNNMQ